MDIVSLAWAALMVVLTFSLSLFHGLIEIGFREPMRRLCACGAS